MDRPAGRDTGAGRPGASGTRRVACLRPRSGPRNPFRRLTGRRWTVSRSGARRPSAPMCTRRLSSASSADLDPAGGSAGTSVPVKPSRSPREPPFPRLPIRSFRSRSAGSRAISSGWSRRLRPAATSAVAARTSRPATLVLEQRRILRPQDLGAAQCPGHVGRCRHPPAGGDHSSSRETSCCRREPRRGDQIADMNSVMVQAPRQA